MTSAPRSASSIVQYGPARTVDRSATSSPARGPAASESSTPRSEAGGGPIIDRCHGAGQLIAPELIAFVAAIGAGSFGALVGVGGGLITVPLLTIGLGVDIKLAIAASLLGVIATSASAAASYLERGLADRRLGLSLLVASAFGGIFGGYLAGLLEARTLTLLFAALLVAVAVQ